jgi:thiamine-monophosphate kinase
VDALSPGCGVVGGDLSTSAVFTVSVTAFGDLGGRAPVLRAGARPGDVLAVSGELGRAARGLARLFRDGVDAHGEPSRSATVASGADTDPDVDRQRRPVPPIADGPLAATAGATAMLDLSDGLAIDAGRLARASRVTLDLDADGVAGADDLALHGGEDHGLLATFPPGVTLPGGFRRIGAVVARGGTDLVRGGEPVPTTGWDPYADWDGAAG